MKERPIFFSAPMVRAILAGTKTQTRRAVKPQPSTGWEFEVPPVFGRITSPHPKRGRFGVFIRQGVGTDFPQIDLIPCPCGQPGDRLWVRETWQAIDGNERARRIMTQPNPSRGWIEYAATVPEGYEPPPRWRPSIHMPRWASRITLEVTGVRVERLQDISEADAAAEGITPYPGHPGRWLSEHRPGLNYPSAIAAFRDLWESINGPGSWDANPWVWVVEVKRVEGGAA